MLRDDVFGQIKEAMKKQEKVRLESLRFLWSEIRNMEIDLKRPVEDEELIGLVRKEVKKRTEVIDQLKKAGRDETVMEEQAKLSVLEEFIEEMSEDEVGEMIDSVIDAGVRDFGAVMREVLKLTDGKANGKMVSGLVKQKLG